MPGGCHDSSLNTVLLCSRAHVESLLGAWCGVEARGRQLGGTLRMRRGFAGAELLPAAHSWRPRAPLTCFSPMCSALR